MKRWFTTQYDDLLSGFFTQEVFHQVVRNREEFRGCQEKNPRSSFWYISHFTFVMSRISEQTFDQKQSFKALWIVLFKHGQNLQRWKRSRSGSVFQRRFGTFLEAIDACTVPLRTSQQQVSTDASYRVPRSHKWWWWIRCASRADEREANHQAQPHIDIHSVFNLSDTRTFSDCFSHSCRSISASLTLVLRQSCLLTDSKRPLGSRGPMMSYQMGLPSRSKPHNPPDT